MNADASAGGGVGRRVFLRVERKGQCPFRDESITEEEHDVEAQEVVR